jgi:hypothetical protein
MFEKICDFLMMPENDWVLLLVLLSVSILISALIYFIGKKGAEKELKGLEDVKK